MTTSNIGALSVEITADSSGLKAEIKGAEAALSKGRKSLNDNAAAFTKWSAAGVTAAAAIGAAIFKTTSANVRELKNLSFAANELTEDFQRGAYAAQQFGISQEKYGDILKDVNDRVGDFITTGGGPMLDFFEQVAPKVGITADAFRGLSGQDAMGLFVKSLQDANLSQEEMTFHMEAMASDATQLLPLFKDNAAALNAMSEEAKALGIGLTAIDVEKVEQANKALDAAGATIDAALQAAVVELAPVVTAIVNQFKQAGIEAGGFGDLARDGINEVISAIGFGMDAVEGIKRVFQVLGRTVALVVLGIEESMLAVADAIVNKPIEAVNELIDAYNSIPLLADVEKVSLSGFGETIKSELGIVRKSIALGIADIEKILAAPMPSTELELAVKRAREQAEEAAKITADLNAPETGQPGSDEESPKVAALKQETAQILEELQNRYASEQELLNNKFIAEQEALANARENGLITDAEHNAILQQNKQEHEDKLTEIEATAKAANLQQASDTFGALATIMSTGGKKTEKAVRALSIAQAIIKGHESAVAAYAAGMATGGPAAPATAALYAAASIAQTGMMIAKLKSGSKSPSRPNGRTPAAPIAATENANDSGEGGTTRNISINLGGDAFTSTEMVRQLIEQINNEVGDGVTLNATNLSGA